MGAKRERFCRFGSRHSYRSESSKWFLICSRFALALLIPGSIVCVCVWIRKNDVTTRYQSGQSVSRQLNMDWYISNDFQQIVEHAKSERKSAVFFPILLYEFFFPTTQNKHQASQIEVKRILNWQNALDIVLTPFVITSSCMHTPPTATAAIAAGHTERLYTLSHSHTQFSSVGCRARQLYSLACSHTINNHHMYFQRGKTLK